MRLRRGIPALLLAAGFGVWNAAVSASAGTGDCAALHADAEAAMALRDADPERGVTLAVEALQHAVSLQPACPLAEAMLHSAVGVNLNILGRNADAVERHARALALLDAVEATPAQKAVSQRGMGVALADLERFEEAVAHFLAALDASEAAGEVLDAAKAAGNIGNLYSSLGQLDRSRAFHERALRGFQDAGFKPGIAGTLINLGALAAKFASAAEEAGDEAGMRRQNEELLDYNTQALALFAELGNERGVAYASSNIGLALDRQGSPALAREYHERALALRRKVGDVHGEINSLATLAATLAHLGKPLQAQRLLDEATARLPAPNLGLQLLIADAAVEVSESQGDHREAMRRLRDAARLRSRIADEDHRARIAQMQREIDRVEQARQVELLHAQAGDQGGRQVSPWIPVLVALLATLLMAVPIVWYAQRRADRAAARELCRMSATDPLTGLLNRSGMLRRIERERVRAQHDGTGFALVMVDLDGFGQVNDRHGLAVGDQVLQEVARRIRAQLRETDVVARWGGDVFLLLLPEMPRPHAAMMAERLRLAIGGVAFTVDGQALALTATLGVAACRGTLDLDGCVRRADQALHMARHQGCDRVNVAA